MRIALVEVLTFVCSAVRTARAHALPREADPGEKPTKPTFRGCRAPKILRRFIPAVRRAQ